MKKTNTHKVIAALALVAGAAGLGTGAAYAAAPSTDAPPSTEAPASPDAEPSTDAPADSEEVIFETDEEFTDYLDSLGPEKKAEMIEEMKATNVEVIAALDEAGIDYELVTDPVTGVEFPGIDAEDEPAMEKLLEDICDDQAEAGDGEA